MNSGFFLLYAIILIATKRVEIFHLFSPSFVIEFVDLKLCKLNKLWKGQQGYKFSINEIEFDEKKPLRKNGENALSNYFFYGFCPYVDDT